MSETKAAVLAFALLAVCGLVFAGARGPTGQTLGGAATAAPWCYDVAWTEMYSSTSGNTFDFQYTCCVERGKFEATGGEQVGPVRKYVLFWIPGQVPEQETLTGDAAKKLCMEHVKDEVGLNA